MSDVNVKGRQPSLTIHRRPGDVLDPRANEPAVKTLGRKIPLRVEIAQMLDAFIMRHRPQFPGADMSPFLLFSIDGHPLSLRSVNAVFERIVECFPQFAGILSPHILRYTYNDMPRRPAAGIVAVELCDLTSHDDELDESGWLRPTLRRTIQHSDVPDRLRPALTSPTCEWKNGTMAADPD